MRRVVSWVVGLGMIALAALIGTLTLGDTETAQPFVVEAAVGERAEARLFAATVREVRATEQLSDASGWQAGGTWVVVDLDVEAMQTEVASLLSLAELDLGDRVISASERPESLRSASLRLGIPQSGSLAFELPEGALTGEATLRLGRSLETRVDTIVELRIDLAAIEREPSIELRETGWAQ
ncbi:hypothetical protein [Agrococcus sp. Marseille-P2731]|uniref:hypothetical protein n=1 Tax=Agrococcus sp. Marseille-P2731 TaxID=1841862 RepID=UPI0009306370|nr:hypothetical protein [Agrococcus sp. Marseille-P2731]